MKNDIDYSIYLCTDRDLMSCSTIEESVELALQGGTTLIQLREKNCDSKEFYEMGLRVREITKAYNVPLIVNDRLDIALAIDADGIHVGQSDLPCSVVRKIVPKDFIVGVSATNLAEAIQAEKDGANYIGVGAMYSTSTKTDAKVVSIDELKAIRKAVNIPIVVIGGINKNTLVNFKGMGIDGIAVVSAIVSQKDISKASEELVKLWND